MKTEKTAEKRSYES